MTSLLRPFLLLGALLAAACQTSPAPCEKAQTLVDAVAKKHPNVSRLTVHAVPPSGGDYCAVASTLASKRGMKSDPEDLRAMTSGEVIVLDENGAHDVTVPILPKDGKFTATAGVTIAAGTPRDAALMEAKAIAAELAAGMEDCACCQK